MLFNDVALVEDPEELPHMNAFTRDMFAEFDPDGSPEEELYKMAVAYDGYGVTFYLPDGHTFGFLMADFENLINGPKAVLKVEEE